MSEFPQALALADEIGDRQRAAMICVWATVAIQAKGMAVHGSQELLEWAERADRYAGQDTIERGWADYRLGWVKCVRGNVAEGVPLLRSAIELARRLDNQELLGLAGRWWGSFGQLPWSDVDEALQVAENLATARNNDVMLDGALAIFERYGRRERMEAMRRAIGQLAATTGEAHHVATSHRVDSASALRDGRLEETIELIERDIAWRQEVGLPADLGAEAFTGLLALEHLYGIDNSPDGPVRRAVMEGVNAPVWRRLPFLPAFLGQVEEANRRLDRMLKARPNITSTSDTTQAGMDVIYLAFGIAGRTSPGGRAAAGAVCEPHCRRSWHALRRPCLGRSRSSPRQI